MEPTTETPPPPMFKEETPPPAAPTPLRDLVQVMRRDLRMIELVARGLKERPEFDRAKAPEAYVGQLSEMAAQSMLAIEDARMRLGKVLQYAGNGTSIYDLA